MARIPHVDVFAILGPLFGSLPPWACRFTDQTLSPYFSRAEHPANITVHNAIASLTALACVCGLGVPVWTTGREKSVDSDMVLGG